MNASPPSEPSVRIVIEQNPWDPAQPADAPADGKSHTPPKLSVPCVLLLCLCTVVCSVYPAVSAALPNLWWVPLPLALLLHLRINRTPHGWILVCLVSLGTLLLTTVPQLAVCALCIFSAIPAMALLHTVTRHPLLICLPVVSYAAATALTQQPILSLLTLAPYAAAYILATKTLRNENRVGIIAAMSIALGGTLAAVGALLWRLSGTEVSPDTVTAFFASLRAELLEQVTTAAEFAEVRAMLLELGITVEASFGGLFDLTLLMLPAIAVLLVMLLCYTAQYLCIMAYTALGAPAYTTVNGRRFLMSVPSALIFLIALIVSFFSSRDLTFLGTVCQNLWMILFPGMMITGFWSLYASYRVHPAPLYLLVAVVLGALAPHILLLFVALSGATATLTRPLLLRMMELTAKQGNGNGDHRDDPPSPSDPS